ncbi:hypothetical protein KAT24_02620 [Candidatus Pacearchaeota archaeon]|nr:hypothetical protein [Candidatus Pacearchaeota archaeon]
MGLFKKKTKKEENKKRKPEFERLPKLPKLPDFPDFEGQEKKEPLPKLPRFPNNSLGKKFSQNTIKEAVTGGKEEDEEVPEADEFVLREEQMMHQPLGENIRKQSTKPVPVTFREAARKVKEIEPIFIRIDKFEESLHAFEKAKQQIAEIEKMLRNIKRLKEEEEKELNMWEKEVEITKQQIEKIDQDIFSKVE